MAFAAATAIVPAAAVGAAPTDVIDTSRKASLTVYKYDLTSAQKAGITDYSNYQSNGKVDTKAQNDLAPYAIQGVQFTYLRVGSINTYSDAGSVQVLYDIPAGLQSVLGLTDAQKIDGKYRSDTLDNALRGMSAGVDNVAGKNALEDYIKSASGSVNMTETDENGRTAVQDLDQGLYLVVETTVPENVEFSTDPFFVSLPMTDLTGDEWFYDVTVYPKNQTDRPTLDKQVNSKDDKNTWENTATASEGDILSYRFISRVPKITSKVTYLTKFGFHDVMTKGLTYQKDASVAFYNTEADARAESNPVASWAQGSPNFTATYGKEGDSSTMDVNPTAAGLAAMNPTLAEKYMVVSYTAKLNSDATAVLGDNGNPNEVTLTWRRTNTSYEDTIEDDVEVHTYGINLTKKFADGSTGFANVQFKLQNKTDGYFVKATGSNGTYYANAQSKQASGASDGGEAEGTVFTPASDGKLVINGLEADTYVLTEIHTADGYSLLKEPITIVITPTVVTITPSEASFEGIENEHPEVVRTLVTPASATVDTKPTEMSADGVSLHGRVDMEVTNTKDFLLPQTGGMGTILFTVIGAVAIAFGIIAVKKNDKKAVA